MRTGRSGSRRCGTAMQVEGSHLRIHFAGKEQRSSDLRRRPPPARSHRAVVNLPGQLLFQYVNGDGTPSAGALSDERLPPRHAASRRRRRRSARGTPPSLAAAVSRSTASRVGTRGEVTVMMLKVVSAELTTRRPSAGGATSSPRSSTPTSTGHLWGAGRRAGTRISAAHHRGAQDSPMLERSSRRATGRSSAFGTPPASARATSVSPRDGRAPLRRWAMTQVDAGRPRKYAGDVGRRGLRTFVMLISLSFRRLGRAVRV